MEYVQLYKKLKEKGYYKDSAYVHLWIHLLILAANAAKEVWLAGQQTKLKTGQLVTTRNQLVKETGINASKVERILKLFESEHQIEQQKTNKYRLITVLKYTSYQKCEQVSEQQTNNKRTTNEQQKLVEIVDKATEQATKILDKFVQINPAISINDKRQRAAIDRLINKYTLEKTMNAVEYAMQVQGEKYAPVITTPCQLLDKFTQLIVYHQRENNGKKKSNYIKI